MPENNIKISIIILTYNSSKWISFCLESINHFYNRNDSEIIVVDNASSDNTVEQVRSMNLPIKIIPLENNLGCAGGNNVGWRSACGEYIIFLNPDVVVTKICIEYLLKPFELHTDVGIVGCKLYYPNTHVIQHAGGILYPNAMCDHYGNAEEDKGQYDEEREVDFVTGAAFATKRNLLQKYNGFDENFYPAYYEETDLCMRMRKDGLKIIYAPKAVAYHYETSSVTKLSPTFYKMFYKSRILFLVKHYSIKEWITKFLPFEIKWMLFEPKAKTTRLKQFRAYLYIPFFLWKIFRNK